MSVKNMGELHLFVDEPNSLTVVSSNIGTAWSEGNFSGCVPEGINGLLVSIYVTPSGSLGGILLFNKDNGCTPSEANAKGLRVLTEEAGHKREVIRTIQSDDGKFMFAHYNSSAWSVSNVCFKLLGYYK